MFWGAVNTALSEDGQSKLPPMEDKKVQDLATVMFYFFIICIILLVVYLVCSILLIWGAAKVSIKNSLGTNSSMFANCSVFCDVRHVRSSVLGQNVMFGSVQSSVL